MYIIAIIASIALTKLSMIAINNLSSQKKPLKGGPTDCQTWQHCPPWLHSGDKNLIVQVVHIRSWFMLNFSKFNLKLVLWVGASLRSCCQMCLCEARQQFCIKLSPLLSHFCITPSLLLCQLHWFQIKPDWICAAASACQSCLKYCNSAPQASWSTTTTLKFDGSSIHQA